MVGIVREKKFKKKKRKKQVYKEVRKKDRVSKKHNNIPIPLIIKIFWISVVLFVFVYGTIYVLRKTVLSPQYQVEQVDYAKDSVDTYDDPYLYKAITENIQ